MANDIITEIEQMQTLTSEGYNGQIVWIEKDKIIELLRRRLIA